MMSRRLLCERIKTVYVTFAVICTANIHRTRRGRALLLELAQRGGTLVCYCGGADGRCHRFLLAGVLVKLGAEYRGER